MEKLLELLPDCPEFGTSPSRLEAALCGVFQGMKQTPQEPLWHREGDVLTHTRMVCNELMGMDAYRNSDKETQLALYLAALLHDIGKIHTTRREDGRWVSPSHSRVGAEMARQILWQELGLCGTPEKQQLRETVCTLIRYHSLPPHAIDEPDGKLRLMRFAANGVMMPKLTVRLLCILSEADMRGRICGDREKLLDQVQLCRELALEAGCLDGAYPFPSDHTAYAYLSGKAVCEAYPVFDDTWGTVILLSGLPGTGKDTWIAANCPHIPMISLDEIRREFGVLPTDVQDKVIQIARERARALLRKKQPFVWNATNITPMTRQKQVDLFTSYGASVRIVYLETALDTLFQRNSGRKNAVPESAVCAMLEKLTPPQRYEAAKVAWYCV